MLAVIGIVIMVLAIATQQTDCENDYENAKHARLGSNERISQGSGVGRSACWTGRVSASRCREPERQDRGRHPQGRKATGEGHQDSRAEDCPELLKRPWRAVGDRNRDRCDSGICGLRSLDEVADQRLTVSL